MKICRYLFYSYSDFVIRVPLIMRVYDSMLSALLAIPSRSIWSLISYDFFKVRMVVTLLFLWRNRRELKDWVLLIIILIKGVVVTRWRKKRSVRWVVVVVVVRSLTKKFKHRLLLLVLLVQATKDSSFPER